MDWERRSRAPRVSVFGQVFSVEEGSLALMVGVGCRFRAIGEGGIGWVQARCPVLIRQGSVSAELSLPSHLVGR